MKGWVRQGGAKPRSPVMTVGGRGWLEWAGTSTPSPQVSDKGNRPSPGSSQDTGSVSPCQREGAAQDSRSGPALGQHPKPGLARLRVPAPTPVAPWATLAPLWNTSFPAGLLPSPVQVPKLAPHRRHPETLPSPPFLPHTHPRDSHSSLCGIHMEQKGLKSGATTPLPDPDWCRLSLYQCLIAANPSYTGQ